LDTSCERTADDSADVAIMLQQNLKTTQAHVSEEAAVSAHRKTESLTHSVADAVISDKAAEMSTECPLPANARWCKVTLGSPFQMALYGTDDIVSNEVCNTGTWELHDKDIADLGSPGHALDIGANVGFYSMALANAGWNVTAFEPMAKNSALIDATLCANPSLKSRITLNKFGLGPKDENCIIISDDDNVGDGVSKCGADAANFEKEGQVGYHKRSSIDIRRLDDVLVKQSVHNVDFVKMDVEGFECKVMAGGQSLLTKFRPRIIQSEVWPDMQGCLPQDYLASFSKASYSVNKDLECTRPDASRPAAIDNRYMCLEAGTSLLQTAHELESHVRHTVWLRAD